MKAFECPKYEILVGLKLSMFGCAKCYHARKHTNDDDDDDEREKLEWMTTHKWMM